MLRREVIAIFLSFVNKQKCVFTQNLEYMNINLDDV